MHVRVNCFVVRGCAVSGRYIHVCNSDVLGVVNMYHDHLKMCVVSINSQRFSVVVNVMLPLISVMIPLPTLCS